ncbi:alkaline phosphatase family protein [Sneathiella sp.]|uniref:alkaline phosphatase family protein n=1 Tax=Sneathiella sp. TaxID=1964365 RepID=UPI0035697F64
MTQPNVLFITLDQWRADCLGATGNDQNMTAALDGLAADGTVFRNHFTNIAPCGPSRTSFLTGMYPSNHRSIRNGTPLNYSLTNLALEARAGGYDPKLFGYTDTTPDPRTLGVDHKAFQTYEGIMPGFNLGANLSSTCEPWLNYLRQKGVDVPGPGYEICYPDPTFELPEGRHSVHAPARYKADDSDTAWLTNQVIADMRASRSAFFHHLTYLRPHPPFIAPPEYHALFDPAAMPRAIRERPLEEMRNFHPFLDFVYNEIRESSFYMQGEGLCADLSEADVAEIRAVYKALITEVDDNIARIIAELKASNRYDETLIIVTSDHGEQLGDHYLFGKLGFYDQSFHIPLIVKPPKSWGAVSGTSVDAFTEAVDIMPTILDGLSLPKARQCDGKSLVPFLKGQPPEKWRSAVHWLFDFRDPLGQRSEAYFDLAPTACNLLVRRDADFKYVHFAGLPPLLFDMRNDPEETRNLAEEPDYQAVVLHYAQQLLSWRMEHEYSELDGLITSEAGLVGY